MVGRVKPPVVKSPFTTPHLLHTRSTPKFSRNCRQTSSSSFDRKWPHPEHAGPPQVLVRPPHAHRGHRRRPGSAGCQRCVSQPQVSQDHRIGKDHPHQTEEVGEAWCLEVSEGMAVILGQTFLPCPVCLRCVLRAV